MPADDQPIRPDPPQDVHDNQTVVPAPGADFDATRGHEDAEPGAGEVASLAEFAQSLVEIGLIDASDLERFTAQQSEGVLDLSRALVKAGKLTPYQAAAVYQKKSRGLLIGNYLILEKIGQGGMGVVFKARHRRLGRVGALKILPPSFARDRSAVMRFRREVEAAGRLKHPNLVAAQDADEDRGVHFLVMDYVEGHDLDKVVRERGPLPIAQAVDCVIQAARGLEAAHAEGIVHRDIKPGNLMLDSAGTVRVLDLGLARIVDAANPFSKTAGGRLTESGMYMGTIDYMAPEQAEDSHRVDHRADIYSLGCTLYYLLTGREPFPGETVLKRLIAHMERPAPSLPFARPGVPTALEAAYQKMVAKRPDDRPASMTAVIALLEASKTAHDADPGTGAAPPKLKPELKVFNEQPLKRAGASMTKPEPSIFARRQDPEGLTVSHELNLEDLVMDVRPEQRPTPLPPVPRPAPARALPLTASATTRSRGRPGRRGLVLLGAGATAALAAAIVGFGLFSGPRQRDDAAARAPGNVPGPEKDRRDVTPLNPALSTKTSLRVADRRPTRDSSRVPDRREDLAGTVPADAHGRPLNLGFETATLADWTSEGTAFEGQPIEGDTINRRLPDRRSGHAGRFWVGTYEKGGDRPTGTLTSVPFRVTKPFASFLVGGGWHSTTSVELIRRDSGQVFSRVSGNDREELERVVVDLSEHVDREIVIRLVDGESGPWGHINFDDFRLHDARPAAPPRRGPAPGDLYTHHPSFRVDVQVVAVRVSDNDGGRPAAISPAQVKRWVDYGNRVYASAGVHFLYKTTDGVAKRNSTLLNNATGTGDRNWLQIKRAGNRLAAEHPGKLTLIFRHGPGRQPAGGGFSWVDYDFVVLPGFEATTVCGRQNIGLFSHETGHYFGLEHTFASEFETVARADAWLLDHKGSVSSFDGDGLSDTPPDPFIGAMQCESASSVVLQGQMVEFDRENIMNYWYNPDKTLSRQQGEIAQWFVRRRQQSGMMLTANLAWRSPLEAETLEITERRGVQTSVQPMGGFGAGNWSGDAQLYIGGGPGDALAMALPVEKTGRYQLGAYLTMGPYFGRIQPWLDGERLGDPIDLYAPRVIASGRIVLTTQSLQAGRHTIRIEIVGKAPASKGTAFGIDCFEVAPPDR